MHIHNGRKTSRQSDKTNAFIIGRIGPLYFCQSLITSVVIIAIAMERGFENFDVSLRSSTQTRLATDWPLEVAHCLATG